MKTLIIGLALMSAPMVWASSFEHEYSATAGQLPQNSTPAWVLRHAGGNIQLLDGLLTAETPAGERNFFAIGVLDDEKLHGDPGAWNGATGQTTVDFRVRCESEDPALEIFQVHISNGRLQWRIRFLNKKVFPRGVAIDPREVDTYRAVIKEDKLTLSSERQGVIIADVAGNDTYAGKPTRSNALWFGSFSPNSQIVGSTGMWELEFIRWTNQEALPDLSP